MPLLSGVAGAQCMIHRTSLKSTRVRQSPMRRSGFPVDFLTGRGGWPSNKRDLCRFGGIEEPVAVVKVERSLSLRDVLPHRGMRFRVLVGKGA